MDEEHNKLVIFQSKKIRRLWHNNDWFYSIIDVVSALTNSVNSRDYWYKMKIRLNDEDKAELSTICLQLKLLAEDGQNVSYRFGDTEHFKQQNY